MKRMETKLERLFRLFKESKEEVESVDIYLKDNISIGISNAKRRLGVCKNKKQIYISNYLFNFDDTTIKNTIIHELLHTIYDTDGHDEKWWSYAKIINNNYKQYNITRLSNVKELCDKHNLKLEEVLSFKYKIICKECGKTFYRNRLSDYQKRYVRNSYKCSCGGDVQLYEK